MHPTEAAAAQVAAEAPALGDFPRRGVIPAGLVSPRRAIMMADLNDCEAPVWVHREAAYDAHDDDSDIHGGPLDVRSKYVPRCVREEVRAAIRGGSHNGVIRHAGLVYVWQS